LGIARQLQERFNEVLKEEDYVAGMWRERMIEQLMRPLDLPAEINMKRVPKWRAPSWSCASVDRNRMFHYGLSCDKSSFAGLAEVLERVTHSILDPFGALRLRFLRLQTPILEIIG
jgi:hypothetical protein